MARAAILSRSDQRLEAARHALLAMRKNRRPVRGASAGPHEDLAENSDIRDRELLARIAARDLDAFTVLYDRHIDQAYALATRMTDVQRAEQVCERTFLAVWRDAGRQAPRQAPVRSWLLELTRQHAYRALRERRCEAERIEDARSWAEGPARQTRTRERRLSEGSRDEDGRGLLSVLSEEEFAVLELAYFRGLHREAIAAALRIPVATVNDRLRAALQALSQRGVSKPQVVPEALIESIGG